jgi:hypothetical protein
MRRYQSKARRLMQNCLKCSAAQEMQEGKGAAPLLLTLVLFPRWSVRTLPLAARATANGPPNATGTGP